MYFLIFLSEDNFFLKITQSFVACDIFGEFEN